MLVLLTSTVLVKLSGHKQIRTLLPCPLCCRRGDHQEANGVIPILMGCVSSESRMRTLFRATCPLRCLSVGRILTGNSPSFVCSQGLGGVFMQSNFALFASDMGGNGALGYEAGGSSRC